MGRRWDDQFMDKSAPDGQETVVEGRVTHVSEDAPQQTFAQRTRPYPAVPPQYPQRSQPSGHFASSGEVTKWQSDLAQCSVLALALVGHGETPGDSAVRRPGNGLGRLGNASRAGVSSSPSPWWVRFAT